MKFHHIRGVDFLCSGELATTHSSIKPKTPPLFSLKTFFRRTRMEIWICFCGWNISWTESPQQIMDFSLNDLDHWGLCVVLLQFALVTLMKKLAIYHPYHTIFQEPSILNERVMIPWPH
ncbi:hypothetical protein RGQ29_005766 [Quercus rubra]|uniref:Uncharacterized protein n=1 Tax=Quercus rubra TaxID=3512 RepID=A0AAN7IB39_QUERU|nr:hypothetical protein RGQ29_005766 [Quercus rubra]